MKPLNAVKVPKPVARTKGRNGVAIHLNTGPSSEKSHVSNKVQHRAQRSILSTALSLQSRTLLFSLLDSLSFKLSTSLSSSLLQ